MSSLKTLGGFASIGFALWYLIYFFGFESHTSANFEVTVTAETPRGPVTASTVWRFEFSQSRGILVPMEARGVRHREYGEALVLDLGEGGYVFGLFALGSGIRKEYPGDRGLIDRTFANLRPKGEPYGISKRKAWIERIRAEPAPHPVDPQYWTFFVGFGELDDPASVMWADASDLSYWGGPGARITSVTLAATDKAPSYGTAAAALPWLDEYGAEKWRLNGKQELGTKFSAPLASQLGVGFFKGGKLK